MARSHAKILATVWTEPDWLALSQGGQRLYMLLLSQPKLTLIGLLDYLPSRWARLAADTSLATVEAHIDELEASRYVVVDRDTDELLVRTLVKNDVANSRLLDNTNLLRGMWNAWNTIQSPHLRAVAVDNIPASVWDSPKARPPAQALDLRRRLAENPRSQQLERHVPTTHPDDPSQRDVPTSLLPSPFSLPGSESSLAAEALLTTPDPGPAAAVDDSDSVIDQAIDLLVAHELARNPTRNGNPARHAQAVRRGKTRELGTAARQHVLADPALTASQLAALLEPWAAPNDHQPEPAGPPPLRDVHDILDTTPPPDPDRNRAAIARIRQQHPLPTRGDTP